MEAGRTMLLKEDISGSPWLLGGYKDEYSCLSSVTIVQKFLCSLKNLCRMVFFIDDTGPCSVCTKMITIGRYVVKRYPTMCHDGGHRGTSYDNEMAP